MKHLSDGRFLAIVAFGMVLRFCALWTPGAFAGDPDDYLRFSINLVEHGVFGPNPTQPSAFRSPGYPLLLAGLAQLTGKRQLADLLPALFALHSLATYAVLVATARLASHFVGRRGVLMATLLVAADPLLIRQSVVVMSESIFAALMLWLLVFWIEHNAAVAEATAARERHAGDASACETNASSSVFRWNSAWTAPFRIAILLAATALVRPTALAAWLALAVPALFAGRLRAWIACSLLAAVLYAPWPVRNRLALGEWIVTTTHGGYTLWLGQNPEFYLHEVERGQSWPAESFKQWSFDNDTKTIHLNEVERDRAFQRLALGWMHDHPGPALRTAWHHVVSFWQPFPRAGELGPVVSNLVGAYCLALGVFAAAGLCRRDFRTWPGNVLLWTMVAFTAVHALYWSNIRMRAPLEAMLAVLAVAHCGRGAGRRSRSTPDA